MHFAHWSPIIKGIISFALKIMIRLLKKNYFLLDLNMDLKLKNQMNTRKNFKWLFQICPKLLTMLNIFLNTQ